MLLLKKMVYIVISLYSKCTKFHNSFPVFTESGVNDNAATENVLVKALKHVLVLP